MLLRVPADGRLEHLSSRVWDRLIRLRTVAALASWVCLCLVALGDTRPNR